MGCEGLVVGYHSKPFAESAGGVTGLSRVSPGEVSGLGKDPRHLVAKA